MAPAQPDLWDRAVNALSDEDKQTVDFSRPGNKSAILSDVLGLAEQKRETCMQKRWKYTRKNGDVVIVRDVCEKLIKWATKFKEVGDVAVQYDPAHASLPWAAVRFFLQVSVNDVQTFGAMAEGLELVSSQITRCNLYEQLYLSRAAAVASELELALLRLYTTILVYLAGARRYYAKGTLRRLGASVTDTSDSVQASLARIAVERDEVERCTRLFDSELSRDTSTGVNRIQASVDGLAAELNSQEVKYQALRTILTSLEQPILRAGNQLSDLHVNLQKEKRRQILSWLSNVRYREHHRSSFAAVMPGSCSWLQQKSEYIDWKSSSSSSILWVHGIPGSGKSTLMSTIIQSLLDSKTHSIATSAVAYFYCARDAAEPQRADPDQVMRAVLKQLACFDASQPVHPAVLREYDKRQRDADEDGLDPLQLSLRDCVDLVLEITDQLPVVIVLDALDECNQLRRHELLQALRNIVQNSTNLVKVMVSSRDDADIVCRLNNVPNVYIGSDDNGDDVNRYIDTELEKAISEQRLLKGRVPEGLRMLILRTLKERASGMFLWASLQIQNLCDPERMIVASDVEDALLCLPPTLFQLYSVVMERIDNIAPRGRALANKTLRWLLCAREPLTSAILTEILEYDPHDDTQGFRISKEEVLSLCCNLVVLDNALDVLRFAHASIREYLEAQPRFDYRDINVQAAEEAFYFTRGGRNLPFTIGQGDFAEYAGIYWIIHYRDLDFSFRSSHHLSSAAKKFFNQGMVGNNSFTPWKKSLANSVSKVVCFTRADPFTQDAAPYSTPFLIACAYGLLEIVNDLTENRGVDLNVTNSVGETGLYIAVRQRYHDVMDRLLSLGADPKVSTLSQETALHRAAEIGDRQMLLLLLQHGADALALENQGWSPLDWAAKGNHEDVIRLLITNGAAGECLQKYGEPLIAWAHSDSEEKERQPNRFLALLHRATGCVGIRNEGQTGFLNSILHFLYTIQPFHDLLKQSRKAEDVESDAIVNALEELFSEMEVSEEIVSTRKLTTAFGWGTEQLQQANDPFEMFIALMHHVFKISPVAKTIGLRDFWSELIYPHASRPAAPAFYISVMSYGHRSLAEAIKTWLANEEGSPWNQCSLSKIAPILVIEVNRLFYNRAKQLLEKLHDCFSYPPRLTLYQETIPCEVNYVLHGVLVHMGFEPSEGKSFIYLRSHSIGKWIRCRNEHVTWATEQEVFAGNFGSDRKPNILYESCTATALIYIDETRVDDIARVMVPYGDQT